MKKLIKKLVLFVLALMLLISGLVVFFAFTTAGLHTLIRLGGLYFHQPIDAQGLQGSLYHEPQIAVLKYQYQDIQITLNNTRIEWNLSAVLQQHELPIERLHAESIHIKQNDTLFILQDVKLNALITRQTITVNTLNFNYLDFNVLAQVQADVNAPYRFTSTIKLTPMGAIKLLTGVLSIGGTMNQINWIGDFHGIGTISLQGTLKNLKELEQIIKWRDLNWPSSTIEPLSKEGRITAAGSLPNLSIELSSKINRTVQEQWQVNGQIKGNVPWNWQFNVHAAQTDNTSSTREGIYTRFNLEGQLNNPKRGSLTVKIDPGHLQMAPDSALSSLVFQGGTASINLTPKGLSGLGSLALDEYKKLDIKFNLPQFNLEQGLTPKQKISSELSLVMNSFDFLPALIPELKNPKGSLLLSLNAQGLLSMPKIETQLTLNKASAEIPDLGLNLNEINCSITGKKDRWEGTGTINSAHKVLRLKGQGLLVAPWPLELTVEGLDFPVMNTHEYQINTSPKLQIKYNQDTWFVNGSVLVPSAQIKIQSFANSIGLSNDVIFKSKEQPPSNPLKTQMDVRIEMGDAVELDAKGLHATLVGSVHIKQKPQSAMNATGELNVKEGQYKAYGQNLSIEQGELFFTGGAIDNPGINLRASKKINASSSTSGTNQLLDFNNTNLQNANLRGNITVGVEVTGRLIEPEIQLFSTPAILSQADILSMLVLGRPASQANKAGSQLLLTAISSMNLGNGTKGAQLLEQLKQNLGIDFNIETNSNYNLLTNSVDDKTAFVVSKSLSKRISVGYNVGLSQADPNVLTLKYLLNKFFSIQINSSSTSNGIDVLYTSSKK